MTSSDEHRFMARAIQLAKRGVYTTQPNPQVGCVLVKDGEIIAEGYHQRAGEPHAERKALHLAGDNARGATAYVTLEPCCHQGRTPPCTSGLIEAGVARVVAAMQDPNPLVAGQGFQLLNEAGIETHCGLLEAQSRDLNPGFIKLMAKGRPYVRCKLAMSLDGRTAMKNGESQWITSPEARIDVHKLRARSTAILTGIGTVLADDPSLNIRLTTDQLDGHLVETDLVQPIRIVLDSQLRMSPKAKMLSLPGRTLIICTNALPERVAELESAGAEVFSVTGSKGRTDLNVVFELLAAQSISDLMIEAGATLSGALLQAGLVDELIIYIAPHLMGDASRGLLHLPGLEHMKDRIHLECIDLRHVGSDIRLTMKPKK